MAVSEVIQDLYDRLVSLEKAVEEAHPILKAQLRGVISAIETLPFGVHQVEVLENAEREAKVGEEISSEPEVEPEETDESKE